MPRFEFRLKALLSLREATRAERRIELAATLAAQNELERHRETLQGVLSAERDRSRASNGPLDIAAWQVAARFEASLRLELQAVRQRERDVGVEIESRTQAVLEANRDVRSLEKLRDKQLEAFRERQNRHDIKLLDEAAARTRESSDESGDAISQQRRSFISES